MEIWLHICKQLCLHCDSREMPDFSLPQYAQGKSALAALSLTSQAMRDISQPVLYHCMYHYPHQNTASRFLRALIFHPRLASYVRVLSLPRGLNHETESDTRREVEIFHLVSATLKLPTPRWVIQALSGDASSSSSSNTAAFDGPGLDSHLRYEISDLDRREFLVSEFRSWKQRIIMGLCCSGLTHLAIPDIYGPIQNGTALNFQNLRVFSCNRLLHCENLPWFFSQAPLLNRIAVGLIFWPRLTLAGRSPPTSLTDVTALSIACGPSYQRHMLQFCNQIRDLELNLIDDTLLEAVAHAPSPVTDPWPASIKNHLRRLRWHHTRTALGPMGDEYFGAFPPLRDLKNLEILEIDRRSLSICLRRGLEPDMPEEEVVRHLPTILPRSLRVLHITLGNHSVPASTLLIELEALAAAKKTSLPMLSLIQIDDCLPLLATGLPERRKALVEFMEGVGLVNVMKDAGIELRVGLEPIHTASIVRGMLPPLPGNLPSYSGDLQDGAPLITFPLED